MKSEKQKDKKEVMVENHEVVLYQIEDTNVCVNVYYDDDTFWLTTKAMAELFDVNTQAITKHLQNIYADEELVKEATCSKMEQVQADADKPTMGLVTWKGAPDGKILKSDVMVAKNYLNEKEISRLNRLVTMFIDYAELMAEDEILMSMQDWVDQTNQFLKNNRRKVLPDKGKVSHDAAIGKAAKEYAEFRKKQDREYISEFDRQTEKYFKGE